MEHSIFPSLVFFRSLRSWMFSMMCFELVVTLACSTSFFSSSMSLLSLALLFWNHVMTWALVRPKDWAISSLSAGERYFWYRNRFSSSKIWWLVKAVRDFRFFLGCWRLLNMLRWSREESGKEKSSLVWKPLKKIHCWLISWTIFYCIPINFSKKRNV